MGPRNAVLGGGDASEMRNLGPSVELHMGPRNAVLGGGDTCELRYWGFRWSFIWGHETLSWAGGDACELRHLGPSVELPLGPRNAVLGGGDACGLRHWDIRWSSLWGHEALCWMGKRHVDTAAGALGGAPYGATKRVKGVPELARARMRALPLGPSVELRMGARSA